MSNKKIRIAVIGAGIIGTSSALRLIESIPDIDITIISDKWTPNTTGDGSAGLILPYVTGNTPRDKILEWMRQTIELLESYRLSPEGGKLGIGLHSVFTLFDENESNEKPYFADYLVSYQELSANELKLFPDKWKSGAKMTTYFAECAKIIPFLLQKYRSKGGKVLQKKVDCLESLLGKYDIVINCTGVESNRLVNDQRLQPIRGQVYRVFAPWIKHSVLAGHYYILQNSESVVLGGTQQVGNWSTEVDPNDSKDIIKNCCALFPSLKSAQIIKEWVGLRPGRDEVRLETEVIQSDNSGDKLNVVHNYGHGGSGVTLFWGCANDVVHQVNTIVDKLDSNRISKL